jgi:hypothetical protein
MTELTFFELTPRAQTIAMALSALGSRTRLDKAVEMDQALTEHPDTDPYQTLNAVVVAQGIRPGRKDNGHGALVQSDTDVAAYVLSWLNR